MALDFNGTTHYAHQDTEPITAYPVTIAMWVNLDAVTTLQVLGGLGKNTSDGGQYLYIDTSSHFNAFSNDGSSGASATGTVAVSATTWAHACGVFASATDRRIFTNGADKQTNATSKSFVASPDRIIFGAQYAAAGVPTNPTNGRIAEVGIWNATLDDAEVAALAKGFSPLLIRPTSLTAYYAMLGNLSPEPDGWRNRLDLTLVGPPTKADHTRIINPFAQQSQ